jgi:hypothetical protein
MEAQMTDKSNDDDKTFKRDCAKETEIRRERRRQAAIERLGTDKPACVICGERDPRVLEKHHLERQAFGDTLVPVCRNCHRKLSDLQKDHPDKITEIPDPLEVIAHVLRGAADLFELLARKFREFAAYLIELANANRDNLEPQQ